MDKVRKGEIAILVLKHRLNKEGLRLGSDFRREVGNTAKAIGIPFDEAMEFVEEMVREHVEELFVKKSGTRFDEELERMTPEERALHERMGTKNVLEVLAKKYSK